MMSEFVGGPNCHTAGQRRVVMGRAHRVIREFWMPGADTATEIVSNECCTASATPQQTGPRERREQRHRAHEHDRSPPERPIS